MGVGFAALLITRELAFVLGVVALLAAGSAVVTPNLSVLVSAGGGDHTGAALGMTSAANSLGRFPGPLAGVSLLSCRASLPFVLAGGLLVALGATVGVLHRRGRTAAVGPAGLVPVTEESDSPPST